MRVLYLQMHGPDWVSMGDVNPEPRRYNASYSNVICTIPSCGRMHYLFAHPGNTFRTTMTFCAFQAWLERSRLDHMMSYEKLSDFDGTYRIPPRSVRRIIGKCPVLLPNFLMSSHLMDLQIANTNDPLTEQEDQLMTIAVMLDLALRHHAENPKEVDEPRYLKWMDSEMVRMLSPHFYPMLKPL